LPQARRDAGTGLLDGPEWRTFTGDAERLLGAGPQPPPARAGAGRTTADAPGLDPDAVDELTAAGDAVAVAASDLAFATARDAVALASALAGDRRGAIVDVMLGVVAVIVVATLAALWVGGRLAGRVRGLRTAAKDTAATLPALLDRIRRGETVDSTAELPSAADRLHRYLSRTGGGAIPSSTFTTQVGTTRPSGRYNARGTIWSGLVWNSRHSVHSLTNTSTHGHDQSVTTTLNKVRAPWAAGKFLGFGSLGGCFAYQSVSRIKYFPTAVPTMCGRPTREGIAAISQERCFSRNLSIAS
jgi:hypothetical protein